MKLFTCQSCGQVLYFENTTCTHCQHRLGYLAEEETMSALEPDDETGGGTWRALGARDGTRRYRFCRNAQHDVCNWLVPADSAEDFCLACRHNRIVPNLAEPGNIEHWRALEVAKHRLFYSLLRLRLPLHTRQEDPEHGLVFDFKEDMAGGTKVMTGHDDGVITIALKEADDVRREEMRKHLGEVYRTLLGHFRHEIAHHYWDLLVERGANGELEAFRDLFGDERQDYQQALDTYYANGAPADWQENYVSAYASAHPWEDFAETWTHYLHIVDTLEMAGAFGISVHPAEVPDDGSLSTNIDFDPYTAETIGAIVDAWLPLSFAVNSLNRSMGLADLYPFVLSPHAVEKLGFIHRLVRGQPLAVETPLPPGPA